MQLKLVEDYGNSVHTHEMTHNSDGTFTLRAMAARKVWELIYVRVSVHSKCR